MSFWAYCTIYTCHVFIWWKHYNLKVKQWSWKQIICVWLIQQVCKKRKIQILKNLVNVTSSLKSLVCDTWEQICSYEWLLHEALCVSKFMLLLNSLMLGGAQIYIYLCCIWVAIEILKTDICTNKFKQCSSILCKIQACVYTTPLWLHYVNIEKEVAVIGSCHVARY